MNLAAKWLYKDGHYTHTPNTKAMKAMNPALNRIDQFMISRAVIDQAGRIFGADFHAAYEAYRREHAIDPAPADTFNRTISGYAGHPPNKTISINNLIPDTKNAPATKIADATPLEAAP